MDPPVHARGLCQLIRKIHVLLQALQEALHNVYLGNKDLLTFQATQGS